LLQEFLLGFPDKINDKFIFEEILEWLQLAAGDLIIIFQGFKTSNKTAMH
jgi:hypothetical protein